MNITIHGFVQDRGLLPARGGRMGPHMMECYSDVTMTEWTHKICPNTSGPKQTVKQRYIRILLSLHLVIWLSSLTQNYRERESRCTAAKRSILATWSRIVYDDVESALASVSPSVVADVYGVCTLYFNRWMLGYGFPGMHLNKYLEPIRYSTQWKRKVAFQFFWSPKVMLRYIEILYGYGHSEKNNCIELFQTSETRFHGHFLQRAQSSGLKLNK